MVKLADTLVSGTSAARLGGSSPPLGKGKGAPNWEPCFFGGLLDAARLGRAKVLLWLQAFGRAQELRIDNCLLEPAEFC